MTSDRWRWRGSVALVAVALGFVIYPLIEGPNDVINSDWPAFATGARLIVENPAHLYDFDAQRRTELEVTNGRVLITLGIHGILPFLAPAWVALFAVPFELLGTDIGGRLWVMFGLACLASGLYLAVRPRAPSAILPAFATVPTALMLLNAQLDGLVALGIGAAIALWTRPYAAGLALGLTLVKPQLMLPLGAWLILTRRWRVLAGWMSAGVVLLAATMLLNPRWVLETLSLITLAGVMWLVLRPRLDFRAAAGVLVVGGVLVAPHALPADLVLVAVGLAIWGQANWKDWLLLSLGAGVAALAPPPLPAITGVLLIAWITVRISGWRRGPARASAG